MERNHMLPVWIGLAAIALIGAAVLMFYRPETPRQRLTRESRERAALLAKYSPARKSATLGETTSVSVNPLEYMRQKQQEQRQLAAADVVSYLTELGQLDDELRANLLATIDEGKKNVYQDLNGRATEMLWESVRREHALTQEEIHQNLKPAWTGAYIPVDRVRIASDAFREALSRKDYRFCPPSCVILKGYYYDFLANELAMNEALLRRITDPNEAGREDDPCTAAQEQTKDDLRQKIRAELTQLATQYPNLPKRTWCF